MDVKQKIKDTIVDLLKIKLEEIKEGVSLENSIGVDSTEMVEMVIALGKTFNIKIEAKEIGKTSIVVPIKSLQKQYEEDYTNKLHIFKGKEKLKINLITGRNNHKCLFNDLRADNDQLPCTSEIKDENRVRLVEYIHQNPFVDDKDFESIEEVRRFSVAPSCKYWSPILPEEFKVNMFKDTKFKTYKGLNNIKYKILRKEKCSYYAQFDSYYNSDVIIFNGVSVRI